MLSYALRAHERREGGSSSGPKAVNLNAGDYLELYGSAASNGTISGASTSICLSLTYIGP